MRVSTPLMRAALCAVLALGCLAGTSHASLIVAGKTNPSNEIGTPGVFQGTINLAVYSKTGSAGDVYDTGYSGLDALTGTAGDYLYLYQVSNSGPTPPGYSGSPFAGAIYRSTVGLVPGASVNSTFITSLGFTDVDGPISATNDLAGPMTFSQNDGFDATTDVGLAMDLTGVLPSLLTVTTSFGANFFGTIKHGEHSTVFGLTSDHGPTAVSASLIDGYSAIGTAMSPSPYAMPEPAGLIGLLSLVPALGFSRYRRRR